MKVKLKLSMHKYITSYPQRFNVLWCPTLMLLSQTCFLLLLSGRYGYDRNCWFQAKMNINIRNELLSSCLGSLHQIILGEKFNLIRFHFPKR